MEEGVMCDYMMKWSYKMEKHGCIIMHRWCTANCGNVGCGYGWYEVSCIEVSKSKYKNGTSMATVAIDLSLNTVS